MILLFFPSFIPNLEPVTDFYKLHNSLIDPFKSDWQHTVDPQSVSGVSSILFQSYLYSSIIFFKTAGPAQGRRKAAYGDTYFG